MYLSFISALIWVMNIFTDSIPYGLALDSHTMYAKSST